ncbi:nuclease-related domain-containing protein [Streptomyces paludis]|uniref:NERD domain-containing protein n=1 Tax=Streptomyces paludis TaxID=2282738 RepID=A0A345HU90_9ACTN|nr:nuclease-related domain-containing protein [Streptomyces paludis]AXG80264.1 NERD domain-containing protein [Streptomyces paludis]
MTGLRVTPGGRPDPGRLYVSRRDGGATVAWYDQDAARVSLFPGAGRDEVLAALAPYVTGEVTVGPPPVPTPADLDRLALHPDDDLAPNRPGEALYGALEAAPDAGRARLTARLRQDARRTALAAQRAVGEQLDLLEGAGWRVLHSIPLPGATALAVPASGGAAGTVVPGAAAARIDHLAIGPAGVLAIRTVAARKHAVRIADPMVRTGRAAPLPRLRWARQAAERASLALAGPVLPVLAVYAPEALDPAPADVRVLRETEIAALADLGGVLKPAEIEALYALARDRGTWARV